MTHPIITSFREKIREAYHAHYDGIIRADMIEKHIEMFCPIAESAISEAEKRTSTKIKNRVQNIFASKYAEIEPVDPKIEEMVMYAIVNESSDEAVESKIKGGKVD